MVLMNYHEMTMSEPRDSPARRKQFLVICTVMAAAFLYGTVNAGLFSSVTIIVAEEEGALFPGGAFVYKTARRDYAAAPSLERQIASDLRLKPNQTSDVLYTIYLDHPGQVKGGRNQRFASGLLVTPSTKMEPQAQVWKRQLLDLAIEPPTRAEVLDLPATDLWKRLRYKTAALPPARAAVASFPFTNGFVSSLVLTYKILPRLRAYAAEHGQSQSAITVVSTCSIPDAMCTHYVPLENMEPFLLGQPDSDAYLKTLPETGALIDFDTLQRRMNIGWQKLGKFFTGKSQGEVTTAQPKEEPPRSDEL